MRAWHGTAVWAVVCVATGLGWAGRILADQPTRLPAVAAGRDHSLALRVDGSLWAWGLNQDGQLGQGDVRPRQEAARVGNGNAWVAVAAGAFYSLALRSDGSLWAWGRNSFGQLGVWPETASIQTRPRQVRSDTGWVAVAAGEAHALAIKGDGSLWAWGESTYGRLGIGNTSPQVCDLYDRGFTYTFPCVISPARVGTGTDWAAVAAGIRHSLALKADGSLWAWGDNTAGQLGLGDTAVRPAPNRVGADQDWVAIAAGGWHSLAIRADGSLWAWGESGSGQLGLGSTDDHKVCSHVMEGNTLCADRPTRVGDDAHWVAIAAGLAHSLAVRADGSLWAWGDNSRSELGLGPDESGQTCHTPVRRGSCRTSPVRVDDAQDWATVGAGEHWSLARKADGSLWAWGANEYGQLGLGNDVWRTQPTRVGP